MRPYFRQDDEIVLFPLTNENGCSYNENTNANGGQMKMETKRDVEEALTLFDQLTEEEQHIALEHLRKEKEKGAA